MTRTLRYVLGWVLVLISLGLAYISDFLIRVGAAAMDREDVVQEHDRRKT